MSLRTHRLDELNLTDEASFQHIELYRQLADRLKRDAVSFAVPEHDSARGNPGATSLLNLAFWSPRGVAEVLPHPELTADQLAHNAWHHVVGEALGDDAHSADGLLFAEAIASAFDIYLVGRVLGVAPDALFLETQVPAMTDAANDAGFEEGDVQTMLERAAAEPEASFESLRQLLFDTTHALFEASDVEAATAVLEAASAHPMALLLHHYELPTWVLYARAYAKGSEPNDTVRAADKAMRANNDSLAWLQTEWLET
jgi:hypothetical protein